MCRLLFWIVVYADNPKLIYSWRMASSSSEQSVSACAWLLNAEFDVAEQPQLTKTDSNQILREYLKGIYSGQAPNLAQKMKGMTLISLSMPTDLSSLSNRDVVPVLGIFHGSHAVSKVTVQALFGNIRGVTTTWGDLQFGPGETYRSSTSCPACFSSWKFTWRNRPLIMVSHWLHGRQQF